MKGSYNKDGMKLDVTDLAEAEKTKTQAEVTKMFVEKASFILKAKLGEGEAEKVERSEPLWDIKKLKVDDWFSSSTYLCVKKIEPQGITVKNQHGNAWLISKDVVEGMYSADHFDKEQKCNMTELA